MNEKELLQVKEILGIDSLRKDIKDLSGEVKKLDHRLSSFWYKVVFVLLSVVTTGFLLEVILKYM